jgi:hypothetical protein
VPEVKYTGPESATPVTLEVNPAGPSDADSYTFNEVGEVQDVNERAARKANFSDNFDPV